MGSSIDIYQKRYNMNPWQIALSRTAKKQMPSLPPIVRENLYALLRDIEARGPIQGTWPNYSRLGADTHHCHIKKGRPCYVAVWQVTDKKIRLIEVKYVGTHEKAPY